jgi:plasmid stability protein
MADVLIRGIEPEVIERLMARAHAKGLSLEAELRLILREAANQDKASTATELGRIRALFAGRAFSDSAELLRADRNR